MLTEYEREVLFRVDNHHPDKNVNLIGLRAHYASLAEKYELDWQEIPLIYPHHEPRTILILSSKNLSSFKKIVIFRAGIHGEEGKICLANAVVSEDLITEATQLGLGIMLIPAANEDGLRAGERYGSGYDEKHTGNDDLMRFLVNGEWFSEAVNKKFSTTRLVDPKIDHLPVETVGMLQLIEQWDRQKILQKIVAVGDGHIDEFTTGGMYGFGYGEHWRELVPVMEQAMKHVSRRGARYLISGAGNNGDGGERIRVRQNGLTVDVHDGGFTSAMALLGVPLPTAVEISTREPMENIIRAYGTFCTGLMRTAAKL